MAVDCTLQSVPRFPDEIEEFWNAFSRRFRFSMIRDASFLNWRFVSGPFSYRKLLLRRKGQIAGCIVFRKAMVNDETMTLVCEAFAQNAFDYLLLLQEAYRFAQETGSTRIATMNTGCPHFRRALDRMGFLVRRHGSTPVIATWLRNRETGAEIYDGAGWYLSPADGEIELALFDQFSRTSLEYASSNPS
jgi:hypothetical protein